MATVIYGPTYSAYARTVRLVCEEKGAPYELVEVGVLDGACKSPEHLARHPFGQVPAVEHDGLMLYETTAIIRYLDRVLPGPRLTPEDPRAEARMNQVIGVVDAHAYRPIVWGIFVPRVVAPMQGQAPDEAAVRDALPAARTSLAALDRLIGRGPFVAGEALSLGDLHLAPTMAYLHATPEAGELMAPHANLRRWWEGVSARPSMARTEPRMG
jgi:glutathione S-transferase